MKKMNKEQKKTAQALAGAFRAAMPLVWDGYFSDATMRSPYVGDVLDVLKCVKGRLFFQDLFFVSGEWRVWSFSEDCDHAEAYGARIIALELAALLAEDGFTEEDFK